MFLWPYILLSIVGQAVDHALYISVIDMTVSEDSITAEIKVFSDDLYAALYEHHGDTLSSTMLDTDMHEAQQYFDHYLKIRSGDDVIPLNVHGISVEGDSHRIKVRGARTGSHQTLSLRVGYLFELFPTQQNIVSVQKNDQKIYFIYKSSDQVEHF